MIVVAQIIMLLLPLWAHAETYIAVGGGQVGTNDAPCISLQIGTNTQQGVIISLGGYSVNNNARLPDRVYSSAIGHSDYTSLGNYPSGYEIGVLGNIGVEVVRESGVYLCVLGGVASCETTELLQSNISGCYYEGTSRKFARGVYGAGLTMYFSTIHNTLHIEVDNRREVSGMLGYWW